MRASELLAQAQLWWRREPERFRNRLLESRLVEAQIARAQGRPEDSVRILAASLPERVRLSGELHVDTGILLNNLATARYHAGQLKAARVDFEHAWAIWQGLNAQATGDALNTLNNWAALELREGHAAEAERLFREALALRRAHLPPSAALAALQNNLGKMVLPRGAAEEALPLLQGAVVLGEQYAGPASQHTLSAMAGVGEAQITLGRMDEARLTLADLEARAQWPLPALLLFTLVLVACSDKPAEPAIAGAVATNKTVAAAPADAKAVAAATAPGGGRLRRGLKAFRRCSASSISSTRSSTSSAATLSAASSGR